MATSRSIGDAYEHGIDRPDIVSWRWRLTTSRKEILPDLVGVFRAWTSPPNADLQVPPVATGAHLVTLVPNPKFGNTLI